MTRLSHVLRDYHETGAMSALIPLYGFADKGVFLTKSGDVGVVLRLGGIDYECLDAAQREAVTKRFEVALRLWDERTRLSQYVLKRNRLTWRAEAHAHPAVDALLRRRRAFLTGKAADLYTVDLYLVVLTEAPRSPEQWRTDLRQAWRAPVHTLREWLSPAQTVLRLDAGLRQRCRQLRHKVEAFVL